jgi:hypothetical protein
MSNVIFGYNQTYTYMCRKFIQSSYLIYGCGSSSRSAQFIVHQIAHILYALRVTYVEHCLRSIHDSNVEEPERLSKQFLNSTIASGFTALQNIKRPIKITINTAINQHVSWIGDEFVELQVHTGTHGIERTPVSHALLRSTFHSIVALLGKMLNSAGVNKLKYREFLKIKDSTSSTHAGEGMSFFNCSTTESYNYKSEAIKKGTDRMYRLEYIEKASAMYRLAIAGMHLSGGPAPRGTEEGVTRLLNSSTELVRNVQMMAGTIGVQNGYAHSTCKHIKSSHSYVLWIRLMDMSV